MIRLPALFLCLVVLAGCATDPRRQADERAAAAGLTRSVVPAGGFHLVAYSRIADPAAPLDIYIEGDGRAWLTPRELSSDPTPRHALGLQLAAADPSPNVVYLARPCQFTDLAREPCSSDYWSGKRFSEDVVAAMNQAVDAFAQRVSQPRLHLIGYSGGGAVATLIAARRSDVASLRTVAGNLGVQAVNRLHGVDAMPDSLDPADVAPQLGSLPQVHFIGTRDRVIPPSVAEEFAARAGKRCVKIVVVDGATHEAPWATRWKELLALQPACG